MAKLFGIGVTTFKNWIRLEKDTGDVTKRPRGGGTPFGIPPEMLGKFIEFVREKPDRTSQELTDEWNKREETNISRSAINRALKRAGLSLKKNS